VPDDRNPFRPWLRRPASWRVLVGCLTRCFPTVPLPDRGRKGRSRAGRTAGLTAESLERRLALSGTAGAVIRAGRLVHHAPVMPEQAAIETRPAPIAPASVRQAVRTTTLAIPPRQQWNENHGYCGETSIQSFALYYGTYASQYRIRAFINPDQQSQLLIGVNEQTALQALRLRFVPWNSSGPVPQWQSYLAWTKRQLKQGSPVIGTLYLKGLADPDYDHIVPFIGFRSSFGPARYHASDTLLFNDNFATTTLSRRFGTLAATRREANSRPFLYSIPWRVDYGCAVTGIVDTLRETVPVRLRIDRSSEPDLIAGEQPVTMNATVTIQSLVPGTTYSLLRYDDPQQVPDSSFLARGGYTSTRTFTATGTTQTFTDQFLSNGVVTYRCVAS